MKLFIDSANIEEVRRANTYGFLEGVTTNPSLIAKEDLSLQAAVEEIAEAISGIVSAEVIAETAEEMIEEGKELAKLAPNVAVTVPMTLDGLKTVKELSEINIKTNVTLVFNANQALLAARAGAAYVSPFVGPLDEIGHNGIEVISSISKIFDRHGINTKIIAASVQNPQQVTEAALNGAHIAAMPLKVLEQLAQHPLTDAGLERFLGDWNSQV